MNTQFGPAYPKLAQINNQLKEIDAQLLAETKKLSGKIKGQYMAALQREDMLHDALEKQKQEANKLNESAIEYSLLKRDLDTNRQLYEGLLEKLKEAGVSAGLRSNNFRIVDVARVPTGPIEPNIPRNLSFAFMLGLTSGVGLGLPAGGIRQHCSHHRTGANDFRLATSRHDSSRFEDGARRRKRKAPGDCQFERSRRAHHSSQAAIANGRVLPRVANVVTAFQSGCAPQGHYGYQRPSAGRQDDNQH